VVAATSDRRGIPPDTEPNAGLPALAARTGEPD
jgi:hypothetical protein